MITSVAWCVTLLRKNYTDFCNQHLAELGLSPGQLYFILYAGKHPGCSPKQMAEALKMDFGHTTRTLSRLVGSGFLIQTANPRDKRAHILHLTEQGEEAFRYCHELFTLWDEKLLADFTEEERSTLLTLLNRLLPIPQQSGNPINDSEGGSV